MLCYNIITNDEIIRCRFLFKQQSASVEELSAYSYPAEI